VLDDFDVTYASHPAGISGKKRRALPPADDPRNKRKVTEIVKTRPITVCYVRLKCPLIADESPANVGTGHERATTGQEVIGA
jgi:hypothetical protein